MRSLRISIYIMALISFYACSVPVQKTSQKKGIASRTEKADTGPAITIDEPVGYRGPDGSEQQKSTGQVAKKPIQTDTKIYFPHFVVKLHNFRVYDKNQAFEGDTSEVKLDIDENNFWSLRVKRDSLHLYGDADNDFFNNLVEIIPKNKADCYVVSFSFEVMLNGGTDKKPVSWLGMTKYSSLYDSSGYFFRVPSHAYDNVVDKEIKKHLSLKDTVLNYSTDDGDKTDTAYIYKHTTRILSVPEIYLRIRRFVNNELSATKYIIIGINDNGGD
jgi:hypothetical protein